MSFSLSFISLSLSLSLTLSLSLFLFLSLTHTHTYTHAHEHTNRCPRHFGNAWVRTRFLDTINCVVRSVSVRCLLVWREMLRNSPDLPICLTTKAKTNGNATIVSNDYRNKTSADRIETSRKKNIYLTLYS